MLDVAEVGPFRLSRVVEPGRSAQGAAVSLESVKLEILDQGIPVKVSFKGAQLDDLKKAVAKFSGSPRKPSRKKASKKAPARKKAAKKKRASHKKKR